MRAASSEGEGGVCEGAGGPAARARPAIQRRGEVMRTASGASGECDGECAVREGVHWRG